MAAQLLTLDYSLTGERSKQAIANGLAHVSGAKWYVSPIPRKRMKELMARSDGPALRDTAIWFGLILTFGALGIVTWGTWWAVPVFAIYGVLYGGVLGLALARVPATAPRSRPAGWPTRSTRSPRSWCCAGRPSGAGATRATTPTRSSSAATRRSSRRARLTFLGLALNLFNLKGGAHELAGVIRNACGRLGAEEATFIPEMERPKVFREARIWLAHLRRGDRHRAGDW